MSHYCLEILILKNKINEELDPNFMNGSKVGNKDDKFDKLSRSGKV